MCYIFVGCNTSDKGDLKLMSVVIDKKRNDEPAEFNSFFKYNHYVALETNDSSLIGYAKKIKFYKGNIYIQDKKDNKIVAFDSIGNYLCQYSHLGQGPGEYTGLGDFDIQNDTLYLMSRFSGCILKYGLHDNQYYGQEEIQKAEGFHILKNGGYALNLGLGRADNSMNKSYNSYAVFHSGNPVYKDIPFNENLLGRMYSYGEGHNTFYEYSDSVFTHFLFNDTLYKVRPTDGRLTPYMTISLNEKKIGLDASEKEVSKLIKESVPSMFAFYKWENHMCCSFFYADNPRKYVIFRNNGTVLYCGRFNLDRNGLPIRMVSYDSDVSSKQMMSLVYPNEILSVYKRADSNNVLLGNMVSGLHEEDNPVLVFYDFVE